MPGPVRLGIGLEDVGASREGVVDLPEDTETRAFLKPPPLPPPSLEKEIQSWRPKEWLGFSYNSRGGDPVSRLEKRLLVDTPFYRVWVGIGQSFLTKISWQRKKLVGLNSPMDWGKGQGSSIDMENGCVVGGSVYLHWKRDPDSGM